MTIQKGPILNSNKMYKFKRNSLTQNLRGRVTWWSTENFKTSEFLPSSEKLLRLVNIKAIFLMQASSFLNQVQLIIGTILHRAADISAATHYFLGDLNLNYLLSTDLINLLEQIVILEAMSLKILARMNLLTSLILLPSSIHFIHSPLKDVHASCGQRKANLQV